jgi:magnesium-transporting ATPase (P-type)
MYQDSIFALVVPGEVLTHVFNSDLKKNFLEIGIKCHSVICSRVSPLQKALVVKLVRDNLKVVTLAIGDGANDVSMIQSAHVGVGIMGREGAQAVRAADYAFGEFRHLRRLLTVHGRYNYLRMTGLIYYSFYKNLVFITIQWWFGFVSSWTGQVNSNSYYIRQFMKKYFLPLIMSYLLHFLLFSMQYLKEMLARIQ